MGLSGLVGAGASDALDRIIQQQLEKKKFEEMLRAQQVQEQQRAQQMAQQQSQFDQQLQIGQQHANTEEQRYADEQAIRMAQASQPPRDPLAEYEGKKKIDLQYAAPATDPLAEYEGKKKIDRKYREPKAAGPDRAEWLIRDGKKVKDIYRPGDEPYDAVADRQPKAGPGAASPYSSERADRTIAAVDNLIPKATMWTTGMGSLLKNVPTTDARAFEAQLKTLTSNVAFNELAQMREASKTGGALGAVSDRELTLLSSTLGAIDSGQDRENVVQQLQQIKDSVQRWKDAAALNGKGVTAGLRAAGGSAPSGKKFTILGVK